VSRRIREYVAAPLHQIASLRETAHRPWARPSFPWAMGQSWLDLLFLHWPVPPAALRPHVPPPLNLDIREGSAWLGITPFELVGFRLIALPPLPKLSTFPTLPTIPPGRTCSSGRPRPQLTRATVPFAPERCPMYGGSASETPPFFHLGCRRSHLERPTAGHRVLFQKDRC
jgi:hypothetical protein